MEHGRPRKAKSWLSDNRGATAVEFAMLSVPILGLLMCSVQIALFFLFAQELQSVTQKAARQVMTGAVQTSGSTGLSQTAFHTLVCNLAPLPFSTGYSIGNNCNLMVDVQSASSFTSISTTPITMTYNASGTATNTWSYSPGNPGDIVILRVMYNWPMFGGAILAPGLANQSNGTALMVGTAVFKNEPYPSS